MKNIVLASSNKDSIVLDCFCGSGTTLQASQELGRSWMGIDQSDEAIRVTQERLKNIPASSFTMDSNFEYFEEQKNKDRKNITKINPYRADYNTLQIR